jgi:hypothetical protein
MIKFAYADIETDKSDHVYEFVFPGQINRKVFLKEPLAAIASLANEHNHVTTVPFSDNLRRIVKEIIKYCKKKPFFLSQIMLGPDHGFEGMSVITDGVSVRLYWYDIAYTIQLTDPEYKKRVKDIFNPPTDVDPERYSDIAKAATAKNLYHISAIKREHLDIIKLKRGYASEIKKLAPALVSDRRNLRSASAELESVPAAVQRMARVGCKEAENRITASERVVDSFKIYTKLEKEKKSDIDFLESKSKSAGDDWKAIKKMLRDGFITNFGHRRPHGLFWEYPPTDYEYFPNADKANPTRIFLGTIMAYIKDCGNLGFEYKSYKIGSDCQNYHIRNRPLETQSYCLGQYQKIVGALMASGQIAQLINVLWNYIHSSNVDSPHCHPDWAKMDINAPKVNDDSYKIWSKANKTTVKEEKKGEAVEIAF